MEVSDIIERIKQIEIKSKKLSENIFSGEYNTAFKGRGMTFSEVRPYQFGDDIRSIDWNVTARHRDSHVKVFEEERELTLLFLIDVSASGEFGSKSKTKIELALELMGVLMFSALANNDQFGAIFVSDCIEQFIPPAKGKKHALHILHALLALQPKSKLTDLNVGLNFIRERFTKKTVSFIVSDFVDESSYFESFRWVAKKHDSIALHIFDELEQEIPNVGIIQLVHAETGEKKWVDTSIPEVRRFLAKQIEFRTKKMETEFQKMGVDYLVLKTDQDFVKPLFLFFKKR